MIHNQNPSRRISSSLFLCFDDFCTHHLGQVTAVGNNDEAWGVLSLFLEFGSFGLAVNGCPARCAVRGPARFTHAPMVGPRILQLRRTLASWHASWSVSSALFRKRQERTALFIHFASLLWPCLVQTSSVIQVLGRFSSDLAQVSMTWPAVCASASSTNQNVKETLHPTHMPTRQLAKPPKFAARRLAPFIPAQLEVPTSPKRRVAGRSYSVANSFCVCRCCICQITVKMYFVFMGYSFLMDGQDAPLARQTPWDVVASTKDECCEDERCPAFRKKTEIKDGCNKLSKDTGTKSGAQLMGGNTWKSERYIWIHLPYLSCYVQTLLERFCHKCGWMWEATWWNSDKDDCENSYMKLLLGLRSRLRRLSLVQFNLFAENLRFVYLPQDCTQAVPRKNTATNKTDTLPCKWEALGLCQVLEDDPVHCAD